MRRFGPIDAWLFAALLALSLWQSLDWLQVELTFPLDAERDLIIVRALVVDGIWPPHGIAHAGIGIDIGPLYYLLVAPFVAAWPSPQAVHLLNVLVYGLGLTACWWELRRRTGAAAALLACLLYSQSMAHGAFLGITWHAAAAPGFALLIVAAGSWFARSGRVAALVVCAGLLALGLQIHSVLATFGPAALVILFGRRADLSMRRLGAGALVALAALAPFWLNALGILGDGPNPGTSHGGTLAPAFDRLWSGLVDNLRARWLLAPQITAPLTLALAALGALHVARDAIGRRGAPDDRDESPRGDWFWPALLLQCVLATLTTATALGFEQSARYFVPLVVPLVCLAAAGIQLLDRRLTDAGRQPMGRALTFFAVAAGLLLARPSSTPAASAPAHYLTAGEQEAVVRTLAADHGLAGLLLLRRTHGLLQGPNSGARYLAAEATTLRSDIAPADGHWLVMPATEAPPLMDRAQQSVTIDGSDRKLTLTRFTPAIDYGRIRTPNGPCPAPTPYGWTEVRPELLVAAGLSPSALPDPTRCARDGILELTLPLHPGAAPITIQLSDEGHFRGLDTEPLQARVVFGDLPPIPLSAHVVVAADKRWYAIDIPDTDVDAPRTLELTIRPRGQLVFLDVY